MAVAYNSSTIYNANQQDGTSFTKSHTVSSNDNRYLIVAIFNRDSKTPSSVTYNSAGMTKLISGNIGTDTLHLYGLANPSTGANNVVVTYSSTASVRFSISDYYGCSATQPDAFNSVNNTSNTTVTLGVTTVADNCWVASLWLNAFGNHTSYTGATIRADIWNNVVAFVDSNSAKTPAGTYNTSEVHGGGGNSVCGIGISLAPYVASGPANLKSYNTNLSANIKSINTNLIANVKSLNTNT